MRREPPLVKLLARQPGMKEARYAQLLSGEVSVGKSDEVQLAGTEPRDAAGARGDDAHGESSSDRIKQLEAEVSALREEVSALKQQFAEFRKQFD
jgi:uncharacterized protein YceH (UPF0502 family)